MDYLFKKQNLNKEKVRIKRASNIILPLVKSRGKIMLVFQTQAFDSVNNSDN